MDRYKFDYSSIIRASEKTFNAPYGWNERARKDGVTRRVFVCPWSDFFYETVDPQWRTQAICLIENCKNLDFIIPTKRLGFLINSKIYIPENAWLLASVEDQKNADMRIPQLLCAEAYIRGISYEPAIGPVKLRKEWADHLDWVIIGCESGPHARHMHPSWAQDIYQQCLEYGIPFYFKQGRDTETGKMIYDMDGRFIHEFPVYDEASR